MYQLFYSPGACSMAVHVLLNELQQPVTLTKVDLSQPRPAELLKHNARGQVPTLVDGDLSVVEGAAIMLHLADKHPTPLLPATPGRERSSALQWLMFCNASLHPAYSKFFGAQRIQLDAPVKDQLIKSYVDQINNLWQMVEQRLEHSPYLAGDNPTLADILCAVIANWAQAETRIQRGPKTKALLQKIIARPAYQQALQAEQVDYKAAA